MCGINGNIGQAEATVSKMNKAIRHRGPDDTGVFSNAKFTIGNNRLAIIDLSSLGHQPMTTNDDQFSIVYNGEIYNFKEIRGELQTLGVNFKSNSDTEVILEGFVKWGPEITKKLRGMWALAILDNKNNKLFLSRDPFGIKPLYLYDDGETVAFSSEIRGLLANKEVSREVDVETIRNIILLGYPIAPRTILKHAKALLPGEEITINLYTKERSSLIRTLETNSKKELLKDTELENLLLDSVKHHLIADVPVGLFFSGGVDSTILAVLLNKLGQQLNAYHVSIPGREDSEYARKIAKHLKLPFKEINFESEPPKKLFEEMLDTIDQPFADASLLPTTLVSKYARKDVKVVLSGEGGDELFGGYLRHEKLSGLTGDIMKRTSEVPVSKLFKTAPSLIKHFQKISGALRAIEKFKGNPLAVYITQTAIAPGFIENTTIKEGFLNRLMYREHSDEALAFDRLVYLPDDLLLKIDTATMSQSLEGRVPFLDRELFKHVGNMPLSWKREGNIGKAPLKRILTKYLPKELVDRPKVGFSIPLTEFFFKHQKESVEDALAWYQKKYTGLIPALDSVLTWAKDKQEILEKNIGYSLYAITVLHVFSKKHLE